MRIHPGPRATATFQSLHGHKPTLWPILRRVHFNSAPRPPHPSPRGSRLNPPCHYEPMGMRGGVPRHPSLQPCSRVFPNGASWSHPRGLDSPAEGILALWGMSQLPAWEILHDLTRPPLPEGATMDTNSNLSQCRILALTCHAGDLDSASAEWACRALTPRHNASLCSQTSVLTLLAPKHSRLGILEPQRSALPAHQKKNVALWGCPETPNEGQPARHLTAPQFYRLPWALMLCLTQPEP